MSWYDDHAAEAAALYELATPASLHSWLQPFLPKSGGLVLDVGAGSGRDADWLASQGYQVVAVEPSSGMLSEAQRLHPSPSIQWMIDSLPSLEKLYRLGLSFDFILLSAVWMHVSPSDRARAFRKLITLLKPGGCIALTLRHGPAEPERGIYPVSKTEIESLARNHGAFIQHSAQGNDELGRVEITWTQLMVRLPDDGSGALPLLRHIILNDEKSSTYKLALLRVLCRIADGAAGYAHDASDTHVSVPLGLVGLYWLRLFKPLLAADLPQNPSNRGDKGLGFVKDAFRKLDSISSLDLRIGMIFGLQQSTALHTALRDACTTITEMPAINMTYPGGEPILPVKRNGLTLRPNSIHLDEAYLSGFGEIYIPRHLWRAFQRFDVWIEPAIVAEWSRLMESYAKKQGRNLATARIAVAMTWSDPSRDARIAREQALKLIDSDGLRCVWSGRTLTARSLDIDHCFPWAAWPCDALWNLMPSHPDINQKKKRDKLPGVGALRSAQDRILNWWDKGYMNTGNRILSEQFFTEAKATLPIVEQTDSRLEDIFTALNMQQIRLRHDQQIPVWEPQC